MKYFMPNGNWPLNENVYHQMMERIGHTQSNANDADFLLLPGGTDLGIRLERDQIETYWYNKFQLKNLPILGICRGMQLMLHKSGGQLISHIPNVLNEITHTTETGHYTGVSSWHLTKLGLYTNSRHHQGFLESPLGWEVLDKTDDGIIEAVKKGNEFAVQWHPELDEMINTPAFLWFKTELEKILS
jgi:gamma-glutamyl-gamma-aminobutyrate hydrolase PuuD